MNSCLRRIAVLFAFLSTSDIYVTALNVQDLGGAWRVQNVQKGFDLPASVPGGIYSDLVSNNVIDDVFYGFNDIDTRWVAKTNWNYSRSFTVKETLLAHDNINLVFDGIDTFSKLLINGHAIGSTENMFIRYIFNVKPYLQLGKNHIEVQFQSPVNVANILYEKQASNYVVPPKCVPAHYNGECHVNHIRKMQASFSWDWGPALPSVGIWKNVYLEAYNSSVIRDVTVSTTLKQNVWEIQVKSFLADNALDIIQGTLTIELLTDMGNITTTYEVNEGKSSNGDFLLISNFSVPKSDVQLWWPNGYGAAKLYSMSVSFWNIHKNENSIKSFRIGFRTIELVQEAIQDQYENTTGTTFYFKINQVAIFAKGSNSIPINILPERSQNETTVRFLLQSAKDVHMNMLRVWGGGTYESDLFYDLADEMGILIWQDFMFACSMYPTNENFLRNVKYEVTHQVRRLQYHPSIVLWAGNNENEVALRMNWYGTLRNFTQYKNDYIKLYVDTIKQEVLQIDDTRPYLVSSPTNGVNSEKQGHIATLPQSEYYGDVHFYNYVADSWNRKLFPISRFASEYGYQSLPSIDTLLTATNDTKYLNIDSAFLNSRQHLKLGYSKMKLLIKYQLQLPPESGDNYHKAFIFYSQIVQAIAVKTETEYYRQWRSNLNDLGKGLTMGALYWQLNDVWAAPSWAGIDFKNKWKMLHYHSKQFFAHIIVTGDLHSHKNQLDIYLVSDLLKAVDNAILTIGIYTWESFIPVKEETIKLDVLPEASHKVKSYALDSLLSSCGTEPKTKCFVYFTLKSKQGELIAPENYAFPSSLKSATLKKSIVEVINIEQINNKTNQFKIEIKSNAPALFVWLDVKDVRGYFSDNGFLQQTPIKTVYFEAAEVITVEQLRTRLSVKHLLDEEFL